MTTELQIRPFQPPDTAPLLKIIIDDLKEVNRHRYSQEIIDKIVAYYTPTQMAALAADANRLILVAANRQQILGTATLLHDDICMTYVDRHAHGQGVGRRLIERIEAIARSRGILKLTVDASLNAVGFYEKLGFHQEHPKQTFGGVEVVQMYKNLSDATLAPR